MNPLSAKRAATHEPSEQPTREALSSPTARMKARTCAT